MTSLVPVAALVAGLVLLAAAPASAQADRRRPPCSSAVARAVIAAPPIRARRHARRCAARSPEAIVESLVNGAMRVQGARLSGAERRAVAEFLTGRTIGGDVSGAGSGRCTAAEAPAADRIKASRWSGWAPAGSNTRFQSATDAGLTAADLPKLSLKWTFGFPDASMAWSQPTVAGGRVFVGSQNGTVYALDARSGCIRWTFAAQGGVRTAITIDAAPEAVPSRVYFGDTAANVYALDAETGRQLWVRRVDDHALARVTGSPTLFQGRLYVGVSSYEEAQGADPQYGCCTFRGAVSALDAASGAVIWRTPLVTEPLQRRGTSTAGVPLWGPSGSGVWSPPTVDASRRWLYVATGNAYSAPAPRSSNAVIALDLQSGAVRWIRQVTPNDVYISNCRPGNPNCPDVLGPDVDFGSPPMLTRTSGGRDLIVIGQKSGLGYALDPDNEGAIVWQYRAGQGSTLGGIEWGSAVDGERAYFAVSDVLLPKPGGLHAVSLATGAVRVGRRAAAARVRDCRPRLQRGSVGRLDGDPRCRVLRVVRRRAARVFDHDRRGDLVVRFEPDVHAGERRRRERRLHRRTGPGDCRRHAVRELRLRLVRATAGERAAGVRPGGELALGFSRRPRPWLTTSPLATGSARDASGCAGLPDAA